MADSSQRRLISAALAVTLALGLAVPGAATANPFLADAGTDEPKRESAEGDRAGPTDGEQGSRERCGGWETKTDRDPMTPPENPELGKCGRCFGGDD